MLSLGALSFAAPWALAALAALPALWWLLRVTPPSPRRVIFPPLRLLATLASRDETAVRTPWWLLALRLALVTALILGVARPLLNADGPLAGAGPVYVLIDDGWASAHGLVAADQRGHRRTIDRAERQGRSVVLLADGADRGRGRPSARHRCCRPAEPASWRRRWRPRRGRPTVPRRRVHCCARPTTAAGRREP